MQNVYLFPQKITQPWMISELWVCCVFRLYFQENENSFYTYRRPLTENRIWYPRTFTGWIKNNNNRHFRFSTPFLHHFLWPQGKTPPSVAQLRKFWFTVSSFYLVNLRKIFIWHQSNETLTLPNFSCSDKAKTNSVPLCDISGKLRFESDI